METPGGSLHPSLVLITSPVRAKIGCQEGADRRFIAGCLSGLAAVAAPRQPERAARLFGAADALREAMGSPQLRTVEHRSYDDDMAALRAHLDEETFAAAWADGQAMAMERAIACALGEA